MYITIISTRLLPTLLPAIFISSKIEANVNISTCVYMMSNNKAENGQRLSLLQKIRITDTGQKKAVIKLPDTGLSCSEDFCGCARKIVIIKNLVIWITTSIPNSKKIVFEEELNYLN